MSNTTIRTLSGKMLDYENPRPQDIELEDIAFGLARACRFAGQRNYWFSVANHAVEVANRMPDDDPKLMLAALHHDSHEAYMCDWPTPLKHAIGMSEFKRIANKLDTAIATKFGFDPSYFLALEIANADAHQLEQEERWHTLSDHYEYEWRYDASVFIEYHESLMEAITNEKDAFVQRSARLHVA